MLVCLLQQLLCTIIALQYGPVHVPPQGTPKTSLAYIRGGVGYSNIFLADSVLHKRDLERWVQLLNASQAQEAFLVRQYAEFVARHNAVMDEAAPRHLELSAEAASLVAAMGFGSWELVEANDALARSSRSLRSRLERVEHEFIESLMPILTEEQLPKLMILRREATRRQCRLGRHRLRWADIELRDVWEEIDPEVPSLAEAMAIENILERYEIELTQAACRHTDSLISWSGRLSRYHAESRHEQISSEEFLRKHDRVNADLAAASRRIASLNVTTLEQIARTVSGGLAQMIWQVAREAAFPEMYPDDAAIHDLIKRMIDDSAIDAASRARAAELAKAYAAEYELKRDHIEAFCIEWGEKNAAAIQGYQSQFLPDALEPKLADRTNLSRRYLHHLHELVGSEMLVRHADAIPSALRPELAELLEAADDTGD